MPRGLAVLAGKAWHESRSRFAISAAILATLCVVFIAFQDPLRRLMGATTAPANTYAGYIYIRVYATVGEGLFAVLVVLLALGGTRRERAHGSLGFTLALPVPHRTHAMVRAAVGLGQVVALAALPAVLVPAGSALIGLRYAADQAATFALLWAAVGSIGFAASFLVSVIVANDYAALAVSVLAVRLVPSALTRLPGLHQLPRLHDLMSGHAMPYLDPQRATLVCVPWGVAAGSLVVAAGLLAVAVWLSGRERLLG